MANAARLDVGSNRGPAPHTKVVAQWQLVGFRARFAQQISTLERHVCNVTHAETGVGAGPRPQSADEPTRITAPAQDRI